MNKNTYKSIFQGAAVTVGFLTTEIVFNWFGAFNGPDQGLLLDFLFRFIFGTIALVLLASNLKKQEDHYSLKNLFRNSIPKSTYVLLIPFILHMLLDMSKLFFGEGRELSLKFASLYLLDCLQQVATGYYEEAARALLMCGLLKYCIDTKKSRLQTIFISGIYFGLAHLPIFFIYGDIISTLLQVFSCFIWTLFIAAIYMLSKNLTLIMILHAAWDIAIRVPKSFCVLPEESIILDIMNILLDIIEYGILPLAGIYICINYDKLRGRLNSKEDMK